MTDMQFVKPEGQDNWESIWSAGYQFNLLSGTLKARIDSNFRASMFLEERINQLVSVMLCSDMDYKKDAYRIGFGFSMRM